MSKLSYPTSRRHNTSGFNFFCCSYVVIVLMALTDLSTSFSDKVEEYTYTVHTQTHTHTSSYPVVVGSLQWIPSTASKNSLPSEAVERWSKVDGHRHSQYHHLCSCLFIDGAVFLEARYSLTGGEEGEMCHRSVDSCLKGLFGAAPCSLCHSSIELSCWHFSDRATTAAPLQAAWQVC